MRAATQREQRNKSKGKTAKDVSVTTETERFLNLLDWFHVSIW